MTLNFFSPHAKSDGKRYDSVTCVKMWLAGKNHLPKDLVAALRYLIPELNTETVEEFEDWCK